MNPDDTFTLNIDRCIEDKSNPAVVRELFKQLRNDGYINIGKFFGEMSDLDLEMLVDIAECTNPATSDEYSEKEIARATEITALLGMALTVGEGGVLTEEACEQGLKVAIMYIAIEGLYRKGLVNVFRENWSMTDDTTKPIVELRK